jgi:hypothetical protein
LAMASADSFAITAPLAAIAAEEVLEKRRD